jgi:hypothetical protein
MEKETPMQNVLSLNDLYQKYAGGILKKEQFEGLLFTYILDNHQQFHLHNWNRDDCIDYLSWLYPRLKRAIDSYREAGSCFENYIKTIVHWSSKEYRSDLIRTFIGEHTAWTIGSIEMEVHENEPEYPRPELNVRRPFKRRQILFLLLKCYFFVSDDLLTRISPVVGIKKDRLIKIITRLRGLRARREAEIRRLQERKYGLFYRCIAYEKIIKAMAENPVHQNLIKVRLERVRQRLEAIKRRLSKIHVHATNRQIAEVLGIPKGTVDSALSTLKYRIQQNKWLSGEE